MGGLLEQIKNQYTESRDFLYTRKLRQVQQLKLLNNLRRGDENIASTMLFSFFNRVMSNLYEDKIQIKFVPSEEMDYKKIEVLNKMALNDFQEMDMAKHEYEWIWDALFFGEGIIETHKFDKKRKIMIPTVVNPLAFAGDPFFSEPQQWRYYWKWVLKSGHEIKRLIDEGVITGISSVRELPNGYEADLWNFKVQRDQAKYLLSTSDASLANSSVDNVYQILEIYTTDLEGNKIVCWVDKGFGKILMMDRCKTKGWPIVRKQLFKEPHSSISFSIPDLIEDKHRAESVLLNLIFIAAKDEANPLYQYVPEKVKDITQLFQRQINQHIPVEEIDAIRPLTKDSSLSTSLLMFLQLLKGEASDPIGTGQVTNPLKKGSKETATAAALQQQLNDLAQSLQTKVLQIGEKEFWGQWFQRYMENTKSGDDKIIALTSVKGVSFESIDLGDIRTKYPPRIEVHSAKEAEYKELVEKRDMMQIYPQFAQTLGDAGIKNFNKFVFMPKFVHDSSTIDLMLPKSIDELRAEEENEMLNNDQLAPVKETDDHETHLYVHASATNTPASISHRFWHQELLGLQKKAEKAAAQAPPSPPNIGVKERNPQNAAVPLQSQVTTGAAKVAKV